jgi:hypothetical protein
LAGAKYRVEIESCFGDTFLQYLPDVDGDTTEQSAISFLERALCEENEIARPESILKNQSQFRFHSSIQQYA